MYAAHILRAAPWAVLFFGTLKAGDLGPAGETAMGVRTTDLTDPDTRRQGAASAAAPSLPPVARRFEELEGLVSLAGETSERAEVRAPLSRALLGQVPLCSSADVADAVRRGRLAQRAWSDIPVEDRCRILVRFHDLLLDRYDEALDVIQLETGKARRHAFEEVADVAIVARYYGQTAIKLLRPRRRRGAIPVLTRTREFRHPRGVVGIIAPWNYPLSLSAADSLPALAAGNAVVLKPDLQTSHAALWALALLREAGLPLNVLQVVTGDGPGTGGALVDHADFISFTGSTATGRVVAGRAASRLIGCSLELGGKNAMIVRADADLEKAVAGAVRGCFANAGQLCVSIERLYVHAVIFEPFLEAFVDRTRELRLGAGFDFEADVGSLISERQLRKVQMHVDEAAVGGARVHTGGRSRPDIGPYFFEPTILTDVTSEMRIFSEETFGPVVAVSPFHSDDEAVELANDSSYGLSASVWTQDPEQGIRIARRLEAGTVNVNEAYAAAWGSVDAPMGGFKESGVGRRHGVEGLLKFTEPQTVAVQRGVPLDLAAPELGSARYRGLVRRVLRHLRRVPGLR
jgi:acyl-CoA reductase-like NAD-dependent aldehyde dehydrogenase